MLDGQSRFPIGESRAVQSIHETRMLNEEAGSACRTDPWKSGPLQPVREGSKLTEAKGGRLGLVCAAGQPEPIPLARRGVVGRAAAFWLAENSAALTSAYHHWLAG